LEGPHEEAPALLEDATRAKARVAEALSGVSRITVVMSGKGGVGKSAVAVNLAAALSQRGERVGLLDADLQGPSVAKMLGLRGWPVRVSADEQVLPVPGPLGIAVQSLDFFLEGNQAPDWDGPDAEGATLRSAMEEAAIVDLLGRTRWGALDTLVIDLAPGADRPPALCRWLPPRVAALAVTIPTEVSLLAVERSLRRVLAARIPLLGLVENFSSVACTRCGEQTPLFPEGDAALLAHDHGVEVAARIPFDPELSRTADTGEVYLEGAGRRSPAGLAFAGLAERVATEHPVEGDGGGSPESTGLEEDA
jgi:ATP-binding protein involved in chromosome partitioning